MKAKPRIGDIWNILEHGNKIGDIKILHIYKGYAMVTRKGCAPGIRSLLDFRNQNGKDGLNLCRRRKP